MRPSILVWALVCALCTVPPASALAETSNDEVAAELKEMKKALQQQNEVIQKQQAKIDELERRQETVGTAVRAEPVEARTQRREAPGQIGALLPEIGVVGDVVATSSQKRSDTEGNDRIAARELELVLGNYVDPYSRFDATIAFSDFAEVDLEEAYLTRWGLPGDWRARVGKFFPRVGKEGSIHRDSLSTVDEPFVIRDFFGNEGFARAGADLTRPFEGPFGSVWEPAVGVLEGGAGEDAVTFGTNKRRPVVYGHLKTFKGIGDFSSVELGLTGLVGAGPNDNGFQVNVLGADATLIHHFTPTHKLLLQSEAYVQDRGGASVTDDTGARTRYDQHPWGVYLLGDYRFAPRWSAGLRLDQVRPVDAAGPRALDQGISAFLTFYQSEFARWRLQFRHETDVQRKEDNAVFVQGTFAIGTHKHKIQ